MAVSKTRQFLQGSLATERIVTAERAFNDRIVIGFANGLHRSTHQEARIRLAKDLGGRIP